MAEKLLCLEKMCNLFQLILEKERATERDSERENWLLQGWDDMAEDSLFWELICINSTITFILLYTILGWSQCNWPLEFDLSTPRCLERHPWCKPSCQLRIHKPRLHQISRNMIQLPHTGSDQYSPTATSHLHTHKPTHTHRTFYYIIDLCRFSLQKPIDPHEAVLMEYGDSAFLWLI